MRARHIDCTSDVGLEVLHRFPLVDKTVMRERLSEFWVTELGPGTVGQTSGSSGVPFKFLKDNRSRPAKAACVIRERRMQRLPMFGRRVADLFVPHDQRMIQLGLRNGIEMIWHGEIYSKEAARQLWAWRPHVIYSRPSVLMDSLTHLAATRAGPATRCLQAVITHSELLPASTRDAIETALGSPIYDQYCLNEVGDVAFQCRERDGYHVHSDVNIVEVVDGDGTPVPVGHRGQIVITNLLNLNMPFIRYATGDVGAVMSGECLCGSRLPRLQVLVGRQDEQIKLRDGSFITPDIIHGVFNYCNISEWKVEQTAPDEIAVYVSPTTHSVDQMRFLVAKLKHLAKGLATVSVYRYVEGSNRRGDGEKFAPIRRLF
jgi:phenylacetate-CoA ligase